jgi:DNA-binding winged helix-turn-helix (wHTH) protein/tetratricopeptide (TPR) repeat protein
MIYRFGPFMADRACFRVLQGDQTIELTPKQLDLLFHFLERPAALVTREALLDAVWPGANVTDNALGQAISELREALGDEAASPTYIRTVARRGYRFIAPVEAAPSIASTPPMPAPTAPPTAGLSAAASGARGIAVLDYANVAGDAGVEWLSAGIAETVTSDLAALDHFSVIDRWRVVQATRRGNGSLHDIAQALGVSLVVTGSYQYSGQHLRITSRIVDLASGEAVADAKVDGPLSGIFSLQDGIVPALVRELHIPTASRPARGGGHETSNLEAYRAYTEGWLKIESLDTDQVPAAIDDFARAIARDPHYAAAYTGLATAELEAYEMTRAAVQPDRRALASGIEHARHAIRIDDRLAEAYATLSFLLASASRIKEGRAAAQQAVSIEPENWRHQYRLGHASWGDERLRAFERALSLYPDFAYARLETAMVHVARGRVDAAEAVVREGATVQDRQACASDRFPAIGFHWLLGTLLALRDRHADACVEFTRELAQANPRRLYGPEYAAAALVGRGHAELTMGQRDRAIESFRAALTHIDGYARAWLGLVETFNQSGDQAGAREARDEASRSLDALRQTDRLHDALLLEACDALRHGTDRTLALLNDLIEHDPPSVVGWTIPIEPMLRPLHGHAGFAALLRRLADGAR